MPIEYAIVNATKNSEHQTGESLLAELSETVNAAIASGWEPTGGLIATRDYIAQAMIRPKKTKKGTAANAAATAAATAA